MVKLIGILLIASGILSLMAGAFVDLKFGSNPELTGNVVSNLISQPKVHLGFYDYFEAVTLSYSIASLVMGLVFLFRM